MHVIYFILNSRQPHTIKKISLYIKIEAFFSIKFAIPYDIAMDSIYAFNIKLRSVQNQKTGNLNGRNQKIFFTLCGIIFGFNF